ncbi:MAG TPA: HDOD domain-containing protein [Terracidiphilus sp.]
MKKKTVRRAEPGGNTLLADSLPLEVELAQDLPAVPVLPETLLRLDLEVQESSVDLGAVTQVVLNDLGATVQIFRLAGREYGNGQGRPTRIEDCISVLGVSACMEAISLETIAHDYRYKAVTATWAHSQEIARYAKVVAERMPEANPDEAYLVGLFHSIALLPPVLGWYGSQGKTIDLASAGFRIAKQWALPRFAIEYFDDTRHDQSASPWAEILNMAHRFANKSSIPCPLEHRFRPQLYRAV